MSIISFVTLSKVSLSFAPLYLLKSNGFPYVIVNFQFPFSPPFIPHGITGAPLLTAKNAAPSFTSSPLAKPFLVPSGNSAKQSPFFKVFKDSFIPVISF